MGPSKSINSKQQHIHGEHGCGQLDKGIDNQRDQQNFTCLDLLRIMITTNTPLLKVRKAHKTGRS
jgi:hypothetical protein